MHPLHLEGDNCKSLPTPRSDLELAFIELLDDAIVVVRPGVDDLAEIESHACMIPRALRRDKARALVPAAYAALPRINFFDS